MPCDTPPPPAPLDDVIVGNEEEPDDSMYEVIDMDELEEMPIDDSIITFSAHTDAVFCCNFDRSCHFVVTGGQDEKAFVWNVLDKTKKFECTGHSESVIAASFSADSKYVSTADMNGFIQVWNVEDGTVAWSFDTFEITWTDWLQSKNALIAGSADGNCWMWDIPDGTSTIFEHTGSACHTGCISHNGEKLVSGYLDGSLKLWDIHNHKLLKTLSAVHKGNVTSVVFSMDDSLILSGSEDGCAKLIKAADLKVLWNIDGCDSGHENVSIESVGFSNNLSCVVIGTNCGALSIWDVQSKTKRNSIELDSAIVKIICDEFDPLLYVAVGNGVLQAFDIRTGSNVKTWEGHEAALFDLAVSSDRSLLLTASEDHSCKVFERGIL